MIWLFFLIRGLFYVSATPLWEGFDEWAHYAVLQSTAAGPVSREVQASLELAPIPWQMGGATAALKHDAYWRMPEPERRAREEKLRSLPAEWAREPAQGGERSYEAQQAPLYYWLLTPAYRLTAGLPLPTRVWLLRLLSLLIASVVIPLSFLMGRAVLEDDSRGLLVSALVAAYPQLMMTVCHIANDSLAVALGSLFLFALFQWKQRPLSTRWAVASGVLLGLALLTKAFFLALVPPVFVFAILWARRKGLLLVSLALAISAWWYWRNWTLTHSLSGNQFEAGRGVPGIRLIYLARQIDWLKAADFTFLSHIWLGNWSFLVVRSWMYHVVAGIAILAAAGLVVRLVRRPNSRLLLLSAIYLTFLAALAYHALRAFQNASFAGALGYYLFGIVIAEAILLTAGLGRATPILIFCLAGIELFGMTFLLIPYYTGLIAHLPSGNLPALAVGQLGNGGAATMLARLTVNKPPFLTPPVMAVLWILYLAATFGLIAAACQLAAKPGSRNPADRQSPPD